MAKVRSKDTAPEMLVRHLLFSMGYRYRIHRKDLPGCPDIAFISKRKVIFVNGCFWHQHKGCARAIVPGTNKSYWIPKLERNKIRDSAALRELAKTGWKTLTVWECETKFPRSLRLRLRKFVGKPGMRG